MSGTLPLPATHPLGQQPGPVSWAHVVWAWEPITSPTACALANRRCALWGRREGIPRGVWGQALPLPPLPVLGADSRGPLPTCSGHGCAGVGTWHCPFGLLALRGVACRGGGGRLPQGGGPLTLVRGVWCQALSLSGLPVLGAGGRALLPMLAGRGLCEYEDPALAPQRALLLAGILRCRSGGRASPWGGCLATF